MKVIPSPCLVEHDSITVDKAIEKMNFFKVDYILLRDGENKISGIFTERDLLMSFSLIMEKGAGNVPISDLMTKNVKTLSLGLVQTAPEFMRDHKLRHLPITNMNKENGKLEVLGIVTMTSLYEQVISLRGLPDLFPSLNNKKVKRLVGVASPDGALWKLLEKVFSGSPYIDVKRFRFSELKDNASLQSASEECDALILDIDDAPDRFWLPTARFMSKNPGLEYVIVALTEKKADPRVEALETLEKNGILNLCRKPIDISKVVLSLERFWAQVDKA